VADALENRCGFAIVHGPSEERPSLEIQLALYWAIGPILGETVAQNVAGARLYGESAARRSVPDPPTEALMARENDRDGRREILRAIGAASLLSGVAWGDEPGKPVPEQIVDTMNKLFSSSTS